MIHIAILMKPYLDLIISGRKTIESRLTKTNRLPFDSIETGERIYFKQSSGPFRATALVDQVLCLDALTPQRIKRLQQIYNDAICGADDFWEWKHDSNFASLIWLRAVEPISFGPEINPQRGIAWLGLDDKHDVYPDCVKGLSHDSQLQFKQVDDPSPEPAGVIVLPLTEGNIRHSHVSIRGEVPGDVRGRFPNWAFGGPTKATQAARQLTLEFDDTSMVQTDIVEGKNILRVRGVWRKWFAENDANPGDAVLLFQLEVGRYAVRLGRRRN